MSDVVERAEAVLAGRHVGNRVSSIVRIYSSVITELIDELKAAREHAEGVEHDRDFLLRELDALAAKLAAS